MMAQCKYVREDGSRCKLNAKPGSAHCHWHAGIGTEKERESKPVRDPAEELRLLSGLTSIFFLFLLRDVFSFSLAISRILRYGFRTDLVLYISADMCSIWLYYNLIKGKLWLDQVRRVILFICSALVLASLYRIGLFSTLFLDGQIAGGMTFLLVLVEIVRIVFQLILLHTAFIIWP
jgi:hypothetical protein